jgi:hypothetical protein
VRTYINIVSAIAVSVLLVVFLGPQLGPGVIWLIVAIWGALAIWLTVHYRLWWSLLAAAILAGLGLLVINNDGPLIFGWLFLFALLALILLPVNLLFRFVRSRM